MYNTGPSVDMWVIDMFMSTYRTTSPYRERHMKRISISPAVLSEPGSHFLDKREKTTLVVHWHIPVAAQSRNLCQILFDPKRRAVPLRRESGVAYCIALAPCRRRIWLGCCRGGLLLPDAGCSSMFGISKSFLVEWVRPTCEG